MASTRFGSGACGLTSDEKERTAPRKLFVDYTGSTVPIVNALTGEISAAQVFVATLGASNYTFAGATPRQPIGRRDEGNGHLGSLSSFEQGPWTKSKVWRARPKADRVAATARETARLRVPNQVWWLNPRARPFGRVVSQPSPSGRSSRRPSRGGLYSRAQLPMNLMICLATARGASSGM
jgi:hypothetical protein